MNEAMSQTNNAIYLTKCSTHSLFNSFLYKYWYIIMPLAIMGLFGGVEEEPAQDARRGAPAVVATSAVAAGGGTAAATSGGQGRQRRGKRD